jgi:hypothetical protein
MPKLGASARRILRGNDGAEHLVAEMQDQLRGHFVGEVVARVEHGPQQPLDLQVRVHRVADLLDWS